mgnify:CR=1 FL=1
MLCGKASIDTPTKVRKVPTFGKILTNYAQFTYNIYPGRPRSLGQAPDPRRPVFLLSVQVGSRPWILPRLKLQRFARNSKEPNFIEQYLNQHTYW